MAEIGVKEVAGPGDHPRIVEYHGATRAGRAPDRVAWCSSLLCWVFEQANIDHTGSKSSQSWLRWGVHSPIGMGAVGIIRNPIRRNRGHCGIVVGYDKRWRVILLGGNQRDQVSLRAYPYRKFVGFRMPKTLCAVEPMPLLIPSGVGGSTR